MAVNIFPIRFPMDGLVPPFLLVTNDLGVNVDQDPFTIPYLASFRKFSLFLILGATGFYRSLTKRTIIIIRIVVIGDISSIFINKAHVLAFSYLIDQNHRFLYEKTNVNGLFLVNN